MKQFKFYILFALIIAFVSCEKTMEEIEQTNVNIFRDLIEVENSKDSVLIGDTIWFNIAFKERVLEANRQEFVDLENANFVLSGFVNSLKETYDTLSFIENNFELVVDEGEMKIINVVNRSDQLSYTFDLSCGMPNDSYELRFGIIPEFEAIFATEFEAMVFYGPERTDYDDFSNNNSRGLLAISFTNDYINDSIYYSLPIQYQYYYNTYYNSIDVLNKNFYFFEAIRE